MHKQPLNEAGVSFNGPVTFFFPSTKIKTELLKVTY